MKSDTLRDASAQAARDEMRRWLGAEQFDDPTVAAAFEHAANRLLLAMDQANARPHGTIVSALCEREGLGDDKTSVVLRIIAVLQVAIDVADNLADDSADPAIVGTSGYPPDLLPTLYCLPSLLIARSVHSLWGLNGGSYAATRVLRILEVMAGGQAKSGTEKIRATSGEQGLLLCLPLWIKGEAEQSGGDKDIETWARALGETWERLQQALDDDKPLPRARYHNSVQRLMDAWPHDVTFERDRSLGVYALGFGRSFEAEGAA